MSWHGLSEEQAEWVDKMYDDMMDKIATGELDPAKTSRGDISLNQNDLPIGKSKDGGDDG